MDTSQNERNAVLATEVAHHAGYLLRYARSRVRDEHLAEEAVQETLLAALESLDSFHGRASLRTWLTGILLHKIHDGFRRGARDAEMPAEPDEPVEWLTPDHSLHVKRLCGAFVEAVGQLPKRQAQAFLMGEISGVETDRICRTLGVSRGNLWVLLHRARETLRATLAGQGFISPPRAPSM
jgi:RNA polymerase sigma-70 factor, ECF subfamily